MPDLLDRNAIIVNFNEFLWCIEKKSSTIVDDFNSSNLQQNAEIFRVQIIHCLPNELVLSFVFRIIVTTNYP